jgi:hypothetical protein
MGRSRRAATRSASGPRIRLGAFPASVSSRDWNGDWSGRNRLLYLAGREYDQAFYLRILFPPGFDPADGIADRRMIPAVVELTVLTVIHPPTCFARYTATCRLNAAGWALPVTRAGSSRAETTESMSSKPTFPAEKQDPLGAAIESSRGNGCRTVDYSLASVSSLEDRKRRTARDAKPRLSRAAARRHLTNSMLVTWRICRFETTSSEQVCFGTSPAQLVDRFDEL